MQKEDPMPLTLSDQDITELRNMLGDFRHKEALSLIQFLAAKQRQQQTAAAPELPLPKQNGHAEQPAAH